MPSAPPSDPEADDFLMFGEEPDDDAGKADFDPSRDHSPAIPDDHEMVSAGNPDLDDDQEGQSVPPSPPLSDNQGVVVDILSPTHKHAGNVPQDTGKEIKDDDTEQNDDNQGIDWEAIHHDYQEGVLSIRAIGRQHGIRDTTVSRHAARHGWTRNLTQQVREKAEHELTFGSLDGGNAPDCSSQGGSTHAQAKAIEKAASVQVQVVQAHRQDLAKLRDLQARLTAKAEAFFEGGKDDKGLVIDLATLQTAVQTVESLARTVGRIIPLERVAFNIDAKQGPATEAQAIESRIRNYVDRKKASPDDPKAIDRAKAEIRAHNAQRRAAIRRQEPPLPPG